MNAARTAYRALAALFLLAVVVQFFLAGVGVFGAGSIDAHRRLGDVLIVVALLLLVLSLATRALVPQNAVLLVLTLVQLGLAHATPWLAAFHPVVALLVLGLAVHLAMWSWRPGRRRAAEPAAS